LQASPFLFILDNKILNVCVCVCVSVKVSGSL